MSPWYVYVTSVICSVSFFPYGPIKCDVYANCSVNRKKECVSNEHAQFDSWIAVDQASIDV